MVGGPVQIPELDSSAELLVSSLKILASLSAERSQRSEHYESHWKFGRRGSRQFLLSRR